MNNEQKAASAVREIKNLLTELRETVNKGLANGNPDYARELLKSWKRRASDKLSGLISLKYGDGLKNKVKNSFRMGDFVGNYTDEADMYSGYLQAINDEIQVDPNYVFSETVIPPIKEETASKESKPIKPTVFIVHGHDELNLLRLEKMLKERFFIHPVIMKDAASSGQTLIEKFERLAQEAHYAIVLMTPDDLIANPEGEKGQSRPNVIFELGWFYGRLGRSNVAIIHKEGTDIHSDISGITRIAFKDDVNERFHEIEREFMQAKLLKPL